MNRFRITLFVALTSVLASFQSAPVIAAPVDPAAFEQAHQQFMRALKGESGAAEDAAEEFQRLTVIDPENPVILAYFGSAQALVGREAWMPWNKMKYVERGLDAVDRSLKMLGPEHDKQRLRGVPVSVETRLVAVRLFLSLPKFFNRAEQGRSLVAATIASPVFQSTPQVIRAQFLSIAGKAGVGAVTAAAPAGR